MNQKKLGKFRQQLELLQDRLRKDGSAAVEQARGLSGSDATGGLSHAPLHLGDLGSDEYLQDMNEVLAENEGYLGGEVRSAIARIDDGTFGKCEECGKSVGAERLEAIPFVRYCVGCAEKLNTSPAANIDRGRPRGPADTLAPEGFMGEKRDRFERQLVDHAAGDAGGGTAYGGLAGSNAYNGEPDIAKLQDAAGGGNLDADDERFGEHGTVVEPIGYEETDEE